MSSDPRDYKLDLSISSPHARAGPAADEARSRPFLSLLFACCNVYARVYRRPSDSFYRGRCPRCGGTITFAVGADGVASRTFIVR